MLQLPILKIYALLFMLTELMPCNMRYKWFVCIDTTPLWQCIPRYLRETKESQCQPTSRPPQYLMVRSSSILYNQTIISLSVFFKFRRKYRRYGMLSYTVSLYIESILPAFHHISILLYFESLSCLFICLPVYLIK